ncbi:MAG: lantibiotic protection ABC transporter ATP-binding protein [Peptococcaceae bacterium]|nr:lantibiotic protection ABC transporter ATP-binding protein [Peptococcaceae bacterium]
MRDVILETRHLTKAFGRQMGVEDVSLSVPQGAVYGLLGPNGAGKSTTLKLIMGLLRPTDGEIFFEGAPWRRSALAQMGALIESPALYANLTAEENLLVHTRLLGLPKSRIAEVLETVDLTDTGCKRAGQFSMGMKQRLGIAIALLNRPSLLVLDEPTNGLDPFGIQELRALIAGFPAQGITVILSSHILSEVAQVVDEIGIISGGRLLFQGTPPAGENLEDFFTRTVMGGGRQ